MVDNSHAPIILLVYQPSKLKRTIKIKDLPKTKQPLEKLIAQGSQNLSDQELLALVLGSGTSKANAIGLAQRILSIFPLKALSQATLKQLTSIPGVGKTKAARLMAVSELGQRSYSTPALNKIVIQNIEDCLNQTREIIGRKQEYLLTLYLNARGELIQKETIAIGSLNSALVEPKEVFAPALVSPCASIILIHNHPSDDPTPSQEDIKFTKQIVKAGELLGITLTDHLIVCKSSYFSFRYSKTPRALP